MAEDHSSGTTYTNHHHVDPKIHNTNLDAKLAGTGTTSANIGSTSSSTTSTTLDSEVGSTAVSSDQTVTQASGSSSKRSRNKPGKLNLFGYVDQRLSNPSSPIYPTFGHISDLHNNNSGTTAATPTNNTNTNIINTNDMTAAPDMAGQPIPSPVGTIASATTKMTNSHQVYQNMQHQYHASAVPSHLRNSIYWGGSDMSSTHSGFAEVSRESLANPQGRQSTNNNSRLGILDPHGPSLGAAHGGAHGGLNGVPSLYDLILDLNCDCGLNAFFHNLVSLLEAHFGAQRVSICLPTDATDIVNMPWGLKALWNKNKNLPHQPYKKRARIPRQGLCDSNLATSEVNDEDDDEWHTDDDDGSVISFGTNVSTPKLLSPSTEMPPANPGSSSKSIFSLTRKLSSSWKKEKKEPSTDNSANIASTAKSAFLATASNTARASSLDSNPHYILFDQLRTLEWEADPLIDTEGINNVLEVDGIVLLQRKYETTRQGSNASSGGVTANSAACNTTSTNPRSNSLAQLNRSASFSALRKFCDSTQQESSPWARSPAPSPAVREFTESPFFSGALELESTFDDEKHATSDDEDLDTDHDTASGKFYRTPLDAIGYENTYSLIHVMLVVPSRSSVASSDKPAPIGILSIMTDLIPFPSALRSLLSRLGAHIATALMQAIAHSSMNNQLAAIHDTALQHHSSSHRRPASPLARRSNSSGLGAFSNRDISLDKLTKFYSSLSEDQLEDLASHHSLEITVSEDMFSRSTDRRSHMRPRFASSHSYSAPLGGHKRGPSLGGLHPANSPGSDKKRPSILQRRFSRRPHLRKFLHSYGALLMTDPEKSIDDADEPRSRSGDSGRSPLSHQVSRSQSRSPDRMRPSNRLLRTIIDAIPVHVFTVEPVKGEVTWVSNRTLAFRGQTFDDFCNNSAEAIHEDDRGNYVTAWAEALRTGIPISRMFRVKRFDGRFRDFFLRAVPLRDDKGSISQWFCTMMDIHNEHQAELQAAQLAQERATETNYRVLAESTPIIVFTAHPQKGMLYANSRWFDYSGATPEETYGFQYLSYVHPEDRDKCIFTGQAVEDIQSDERHTVSVEVRVRNSEGEYRWHLILYTCSDPSKAGNCTWFGTCTDINDQRMIQNKLQEAKDAAQRTIESKSRFLSNMSHEIRTPLIGISGMISFLLDTPLSEEQLDYCHTIASSSDALLMVINDILDISKVESGKMTLTYEWFGVRRLVEEVNELLSSMAISKRLELNYVVDASVPAWIKGDRVRIRQVMLNLIGNAIKFTDQGEIFTFCSVVKKDNGGITLKVEVHDTGRGFTEKDAQHMFKPYSQINQVSSNPSTSLEVTSGVSGTGLGLVISRQLVELHGGKLTCTSTKNVGSTFEFTGVFKLPNDKDQPSKEQLAKGDQALVTASVNVDMDEQIRILVVCPWRYTRDSISHHIRATVVQPDRCEIKSVASSDEARTIVEADVKWTHVVLNINDEKEVVELLQFLFARLKRELSNSSNKTQLVVLSSPNQRMTIQKEIASSSGNRPLPLKLTFLPKPLKPSRYAAVFDPKGLGSQSKDTKMESAHKTLETEKSLFASLKTFAQTGNYHILLAEDNLVNQKVMAQFLAKAGLACDVATDGLVCTTKLFSAGPGYYDLIMCDLDMPRKDGFQTCREIRQWEIECGVQANPLPIIALSAYVMSDVADQCVEAGFTKYVSKPVEFASLKDTIIQTLTQRNNNTRAMELRLT